MPLARQPHADIAGVLIRGDRNWPRKTDPVSSAPVFPRLLEEVALKEIATNSWNGQGVARANGCTAEKDCHSGFNCHRGSQNP